ncbi:MAG: superoxide dismutase, Ni [Victivallales bacterium]|nr:superoxide dismutase, Ni [Victivallales bacterium]
MNKKSVLLLLIICLITLVQMPVLAHCEIPCGIYNDRMRIKMIEEDIFTVKESMNAITELEKDEHSHSNQLVRWIMNKDVHASKIQKVVWQYFMTQRIKPEQKKYTNMLSLLHQMLVYSMKCKQTTDLKNAEKLSSLVKQFEKLYFTPEK